MTTDQSTDDTNGVPVSVLDCGTSVTVVVEDEPGAVLMQNLRKMREKAEASAS
jgi:hypothetical protein